MSAPPLPRGAAPRPQTLLTAIAVATVAVLPVFLAGAVAVQLRDDLHFAESAQGLGLGAFFATGALTSAVAGRVAERLGPRRAMRVAALVSAVSLAGVGLAARSWGGLVAGLVVGGAANALAQPATNLFLARSVPPDRQGAAFGVKQSAIPTATLLGGLAVPAVALTVGWRWAFVGAAAVAVVVAAIPYAAPVAGPVRRRGRDGDAPLLPLLVLATGSALGAAAAGTLGAFLVTSAVAAGIGDGSAGLLLSGGSVLGVGSRLFAGVRADRRGRAHLPVVASMLAGGAAGYALLATGEPPLFVAGTFVAFGVGWAWPGLFNFAVVRNNPGAPAAATGITQTGTYIGGVAGPLVFGVVVEATSYRVGWLGAAACTVLAALAVLAGRRMLIAANAARAVRPG